METRQKSQMTFIVVPSLVLLGSSPAFLSLSFVLSSFTIMPLLASFGSNDNISVGFRLPAYRLASTLFFSHEVHE